MFHHPTLHVAPGYDILRASSDYTTLWSVYGVWPDIPISIPVAYKVIYVALNDNRTPLACPVANGWIHPQEYLSFSAIVRLIPGSLLDRVLLS